MLTVGSKINIDANCFESRIGNRRNVTCGECYILRIEEDYMRPDGQIVSICGISANIGFAALNYNVSENKLKNSYCSDIPFTVIDDGEEFFRTYAHMGEKFILSDNIRDYSDEWDLKDVVFRIDGYYVGSDNDIYYLHSRCGIGGYAIKASEADLVFRRNPDFKGRQVIGNTCSKCGDIYYQSVDDADSIVSEDRCLCPRCRLREYVTPYHLYTPHIEFNSTDRSKNKDLFYGMEIEVDNAGEIDSIAATVVQMFNDLTKKNLFVHCSHDSSLNSGFEMITQPGTLEFHRSIQDAYRRVFHYLVACGYRGHDTSTAGIHIHFSREFFADDGCEDESIAKLLYLVEKFWDEIIVFSRRDYNRSRQYMKKIGDDGYSPKGFVADYNKCGGHSGHYYAVNISNEDTIELRMFRSTLNVETLFATLEFVDKLVKTAKYKTPSELQSLKFEQLLTPNAKKYYNARKAASGFEEFSA